MIDESACGSLAAEDKSGGVVGAYLRQVLVATCHNCRGPNKKRRARLDRSLTLCPDCSNALYWERVHPNEVGT